MTITEILERFAKQGIDDFEVKQEGDIITIGYFDTNKFYPADAVIIKDGVVTDILFVENSITQWLFDLKELQIEIIDDYFN